MVKLVRRSQVLKQYGISKSTLRNRELEKLFPSPISIGDRAVAYIQSEVDDIIQAHISGKPKDEIKKLVSNLIAQRKQVV